MNIEVRQAISPTEAGTLDTAGLRKNFLIEDLFSSGKCKMVYSHIDRTIIGGACPGVKPLELKASKQVGSDLFLARREMGVFNIGGAGTITVDSIVYDMAATDCLYIPMGSERVTFASLSGDDPAKYYFISLPAHHRHTVQKITADQANCLELGSPEEANKRILRQFIHPDICSSCQLVMGMTTLHTGSIWNTMPCHIHDRRSEVYLYFDMPEDSRVFHFLGKPDETRHLVIANEQATISPGWSIHSGAGIGRYAFIWSMGGDNQDFTDMDFVAMEDLR